MKLSTIIRNSVLACAVTLLCAAPSWAVPVQLVIQNGTFNDLPPAGGFTATGIHNNALGSGSFIPDYYPLHGTLTANLQIIPGVVIFLEDIMGTLHGPGGVMNIVDGLIAQFTGQNAEGFFDFNIVGGSLDGVSGSGGFGGDPSAYIFDHTEPNNHLTSTVVQLWGGSVDNYIGMDFRASIQPIPEPATLLLFGSGLLGVVAWRIRKQQA